LASSEKFELDHVRRWRASVRNAETRWLTGGEDLYRLHTRVIANEGDEAEEASGEMVSVALPAFKSFWQRLFRRRRRLAPGA
jgi:hypothetical protein